MMRDDITDADVQMVLVVDRARHGSNVGVTADGIRDALQQGFWPLEDYRAIAALVRQEAQNALAAAQAELAEARAWIDKAVASCGRRQCGMMERHLAEARADVAAAQAENARLREALSNVGAHAANARVEDSHAVLHGIILTIQDRIDSALAGAGGEDAT